MVKFTHTNNYSFVQFITAGCLFGLELLIER